MLGFTIHDANVIQSFLIFNKYILLKLQYGIQVDNNIYTQLE